MTRSRTTSVSGIEHSRSGEKLSLLAVFAHPEDEAFGPSGTLAKYAGEGVRVSLVTAARELASMPHPFPSDTRIPMAETTQRREMLCSCRAAGISRICLDQSSLRTTLPRDELMLERLTRLIREVQPQVIVTYGPGGLSGDSEQRLINRVATDAFALAGDDKAFPLHARDGLYAYQPQKLYFAVLPESVIVRWGLQELVGVPDARVTTVLDVSPYSDMKLKAVYCQRNQSQDFAKWVESIGHAQWNEEHFILAASHVGKRPKRERDLFAGLR